jgi:parallel beta-helix repeat protein
MNRKLAATLIVILIGMLGLSFEVHRVEASGTIHIRADGSIDPPDAPISTFDNVTYTLSGNITSDADGIVIERDNIVVDGAGYTVQGAGSGNGTDLTSRSNITIKNTTIKTFGNGIWLDGSNNMICRNNVTNNEEGIVLWEFSDHNNISGNNVTTNNGRGIWLAFSSDNSIVENNITGNANGIWFHSSSNNSISGNSIVANNYNGIFLDSSSNNTSFQNSLIDNSYDVKLEYSSSNSISGNTISGEYVGISLWESSNNLIYHNDFLSNTFQASNYYSVNVWENGYPSGGNYWTDYKGKDSFRGPYQNETGEDSIGDTPYVIDTNNSDRYPLMVPWTPTPPTSPVVYIRADGKVDPSTAPIQRDGDIYIFTTNIHKEIVVQRSNVIIDGNGYTLQGTRTYQSKGICLSSIDNVTIKDTDIKDFWWGITLWESSFSNNILENNITANSGDGIWLQYSSNNTIARNRVTANSDFGVRLDSSLSNIIIENTIGGNDIAGVFISYSSNNTFTGNNIVNNQDGVWLEYLSSNKFYHNNLINNTHQVYDPSRGNPGIPPSISVWDSGYPSGGNYWSDYDGTDLLNGPYRNETGSDGIGDAEYAIDGNNTDHYPLMGMFSDFNATSECRVQTVCNSSISGFKSDGTSISFNVTGEDGTAGFCRICIPTALMNATYRVFVNGTEIQCNLLPCSNSTHSYLHFTYSHSTEQIVIVPEFPSFMILPLFMLFTMVAIVFMQRRIPRKQKNSR